MQLQVIESGNIVIQKRDYRGPKDRGSEAFNSISLSQYFSDVCNDFQTQFKLVYWSIKPLLADQ